MAVLKFEENGQAYFEWLENLTSPEFVDKINFVFDWNKRINGGTDSDLMVETSHVGDVVRVDIFDGKTIFVNVYYLDTGKIYTKEISDYDVVFYERMKDYYEVRKNG